MSPQDAVAFTRSTFETSAIFDPDDPTLVAYEAAGPQGAGCITHGGSFYPQNCRKGILGQQQSVRIRSVLCRQKPARKSRSDYMKAVAGDGLLDLDRESFDVRHRDQSH
jgi:hypothetical protein